MVYYPWLKGAAQVPQPQFRQATQEDILTLRCGRRTLPGEGKSYLTAMCHLSWKGTLPSLHYGKHTGPLLGRKVPSVSQGCSHTNSLEKHPESKSSPHAQDLQKHKRSTENCLRRAAPRKRKGPCDYYRHPPRGLREVKETVQVNWIPGFISRFLHVVGF